MYRLAVAFVLNLDNQASISCGVISDAIRTPMASLVAKDDDADACIYVSGNANTPVAVLELLAKDADSYVREGVARNANTPVATLEMLAKDADAFVRYGIAHNANTPVAVRAIPCSRAWRHFRLRRPPARSANSMIFSPTRR